MAREFSGLAAIVAAVSLTAASALANPTGRTARHDKRGHHHEHLAQRSGLYRVQYHPRGAETGATAAPYVWSNFGSIIYGYPYGTPCYRYNDRDWDYERVC